MKIAFDLDGTLIECGYAFPTIKKWPTYLMNICRMESLREGTIDLMQYFQQQGDEVWIYTTSFRNTFYIRFLFLMHGVHLKGVVNQAIHNRKIKNIRDSPQCSKYPPVFGIDLLIDDQEGVRIEAERYKFQMIWIKPEEIAWTEKVKIEYQKLKRKRTV